MSSIHPSSVVDPHAQVGSGVEIGPFCIVEADTTIGDGCQLEGRVTVKAGTSLGQENYLAEGAVLGGLPQHKSPPSETGRLVVGDQNVFRENVTVHRALHSDQATTLGDNNLLMVNAHVAHDCAIGNETILANNVMLAGHIEVGDRAYLSGAAAVHQFCRVGTYAMVGGQAHIIKDVPPFVTVDGLSSLIVGLNRVGLRRAGMSDQSMSDLKEAYRVAFRSGLRWDDLLIQLRQQFPTGVASELWRFMQATKRGCVRERVAPRAATLKLHDAPQAA